ncbi:MAG: sulfurtransferase, partial [Bacteroidia bacterium]|nr:sulfurtransferase [Bacteroidia bacterium]
GGIINYVNQVRTSGIENKFKGVNFVFDQRLSERITEDVLAECHQCGKVADTHVNCLNIGCHTLFIQCGKCSEALEGCCSKECLTMSKRPEEDQLQWRKNNPLPANYQKGRLVKARRLDLKKKNRI